MSTKREYKRGRYTKEILEPIVKQSFSITDVMRALGIVPAGGSHAHISKKIKEYGISTVHFLGKRYNHGKFFGNKRKKWFEVLIKKDTNKREDASLLRRSLIEYGVRYKCSSCSIEDTWQEKKIILHVDHINGNCFDNTPENLRFLCPNCHSQTDTYCRAKSSLRNNKREKFDSNIKVFKIKEEKRCADCQKIILATSTRCEKCEHGRRKGREKISIRKVKNRPPREELQEMINIMSWVAIGRKYDVSDNAIRKWARDYNLL